MEDFTIRNLGWVGGSHCIEDERIPNKVLSGKFHNVRPMQKQRTRWDVIIQRYISEIVGI
jgi:hypothetical protein